MFRHKQKYKKGKQSQLPPAPASRKPKEESDEDKVGMGEDEDVLIVDKRNQFQDQPPHQLDSRSPGFSIPDYMANVVQERLSVMKRSTLKRNSVTLQKSCRVVPEAETTESSIAKSCIIPSEPKPAAESLCMVLPITVQRHHKPPKSTANVLIVNFRPTWAHRLHAGIRWWKGKYTVGDGAFQEVRLRKGWRRLRVNP